MASKIKTPDELDAKFDEQPPKIRAVMREQGEDGPLLREPRMRDIIPMAAPMHDDEQLSCPLCGEANLSIFGRRLWCEGNCGIILTNVYSE